MTKFQHATRMGLLMAAAAVLLGWVLRHKETSFADGLRYIHQAEKIQAATWRDGLVKGIDHPLHPLGIAAVHRVLGGTDPTSWQIAASVLCFTSAVLLVIPIYLLTLELFGEKTAWLGCLLVMVNPIIGYVVVNVLSESTFLLWWSFGLWGSVRFLREGRFFWLPLAIGFGALAYLTRPEGMLLPAALVLTLLVLPLSRATRINWPRWWRAIGFLLTGVVLLVGPYIALKGSVGTKPGIARVLGLAPRSLSLALEREKPIPPEQTDFDTYRIATIRMLKVFRAAVTPPLFTVALLGIVLAAPLAAKGRARAGLFLTIVLAASAVALVRLHATGGYCTVRHGLVPGIILTLAAAYGLTWLIEKVSIPGRWLGQADLRLRPGPAIWALLIGGAVVFPNIQSQGPPVPGPFSVYRETGHWIAENTTAQDKVLDLTDWSLFFSGRPGYIFANVYEAPADPSTRWLVVRAPHVNGHWHYSEVLRELIAGREPVALVPPKADLNQVQIRIYDRQAPPPPQTATATSSRDSTTRQR
ncbi:MAG TPA: glycosyltransferase family 39 protein [Isosphaeraceae bacterium]|nr:glycosyltransferase family 39 protein [Isosphaeraceae bacterium]